MNLPTDKMYVLQLKNEIRVWLNQNEFELTKKALLSDVSFIEVQGRLINSKEVIYVMPRTDVDTSDRIKRGEWKCSGCEQWIPKGKQCGKCFA